MTFFCDPAMCAGVLVPVPSDCRTRVTDRRINSAKGVPKGTPSCTIGCWQAVLHCAKRIILMRLGDTLGAVRAHPPGGGSKDLMADYIYLLQTRLTPAQQKALATVRDVARSRNLTVFLVGGAVRDLTSGAPIRDLDVVVQGPALKLRKELEHAGGLLVGESDTFQSL